MYYSSSQIKNTPSLPGIYKFYSEDDALLYVGKAKNLKSRITNYFKNQIKDVKTVHLVTQVKKIETISVVSEFEALLLEAKLINLYKPKYNVIWRDDKHYLYIKVTDEELPRILFARKETDGSAYFGPFPSSVIVKELVYFLRTIFPYCTQKSGIRRACFYTQLGLCNPCPADIKKTCGKEYQLLKRQYKRNIDNIKNILKGKIGNIRNMLSKKMHKYAREEKFEEAKNLRDKIENLNYLLNRYNPVQPYIDNPQNLRKIHKSEQKELLSLLQPYFPSLYSLRKIECYDISNISGKLATGSMVTFIDNQPDKNLYRRFRIKFANKPNDFAMLGEVIARRLKHTDWKLPDIMVIDGGRPQLLAIQKILALHNVKIPMVGLAKYYEEIVVPTGDKFIKLKLAERMAALHLIKRIRDEAHRFAHSYHSLLRIRYLLS